MPRKKISKGGATAPRPSANTAVLERPQTEPVREDPRIAQLEAECKRLRDALTESDAEVDAAKQRLAESNDHYNDLLNGPAETPEFYTLRDRSKTCKFYDSVFHDGPGWVHHESEAFINDSGYANSVKDRAMSSIERAFDTARLGLNVQGRVNYSKLPPFDRGNVLEIIVRIVPGGE